MEIRKLTTPAEARPKARREVIAGKYMVQYTFSAISVASTVPLIEAIGTGPAGTIGTFTGCRCFLLSLTRGRCDIGNFCRPADLYHCQARPFNARVGGPATARKYLEEASGMRARHRICSISAIRPLIATPNPRPVRSLQWVQAGVVDITYDNIGFR